MPEVDDFQAQPGAGVSARVRDDAGQGQPRGRSSSATSGSSASAGSSIPAEVEEALKKLDEAGQTALLVAVDGEVAGAIGARDKVRREAHDVIHDLKHLGLRDLTILTGDRPAPARAVAKKVHIKQVEAELTPADKAEWVHRRQHEGRVVAMIGDGINDAPALALADVGIALGGVGSDIAAEAGSVVLMGDPLEPLPETIRLARQTMRIIRQNILVFAFGLNGLAIVLAGLPGARAGRRGDHPPGRLAARLAERDPPARLRALGAARAGPHRRPGRRRLPPLPPVGPLDLGVDPPPRLARAGAVAAGRWPTSARGSR